MRVHVAALRCCLWTHVVHVAALRCLSWTLVMLHHHLPVPNPCFRVPTFAGQLRRGCFAAATRPIPSRRPSGYLPPACIPSPFLCTGIAAPCRHHPDAPLSSPSPPSPPPPPTPPAQYYFETIFPRIPKTVGDEIRGQLRGWGQPTEARGNAGQGGGDRRGVDDGSRRPASVKASLAVAFGQRAPNRPGGREVGRGMGSDQQLDRSKGRDHHRPRHSPTPDQRRRDDGRRDDRGGGSGGERDRRRSRSRSRERPRYGDHERDNGRGGDGRREHDRSRERYREREGYGGGRDGARGGDRRRDQHSDRDEHERRGVRDEGRRDGGWQRQDRSRSRSRSRDARDVFRERAAAPAQLEKIRDVYGAR